MNDAKGMHEENKRSALKTLSWRIVSTVSTMFLFYILTGRLDFTVGVGLLDIFLRTPLYFFHERTWNKVPFGRTIRGTGESAIRIPPVKASASETILEVIEKMVSSGIGAVIVVKEDKPIGLITERDILARVLEREGAPLGVSVEKIMSHPVITVEYNQPLKKMLGIMREKNIRRLAVTKDGKLTGIISERRILDALI